MSNDPNPQEALDAIQSARAEVGRSLTYPFLWDLGYGGILAVMTWGAGLSQPWSVVTLGLSMTGLALMVRWWKRRVGWWVGGFNPPKARWVTVGLMVVVLGCLGLSLATRFGHAPAWWPFAAAAMAGMSGIIGGRLWMWVYRGELQERAR